MRISDWSSDVCSSDLRLDQQRLKLGAVDAGEIAEMAARDAEVEDQGIAAEIPVGRGLGRRDEDAARTFHDILGAEADVADRKSVVEGKSVSVRVGRGGRRIIKKKITVVTQGRN